MIMFIFTFLKKGRLRNTELINNNYYLLIGGASSPHDQDCGIKTDTQWKWCQSHARIDSCNQFWFIQERKIWVAKWGTP